MMHSLAEWWAVDSCEAQRENDRGLNDAGAILVIISFLTLVQPHWTVFEK